MSRKINTLNASDGHIESILIGYGQVKICFQTWDRRRVIIIYNGVTDVEDRQSVNRDVSFYSSHNYTETLIEFRYVDGDNENMLRIVAESVEMLKLDERGDINDALYNIDYMYIGGQQIQ